MKISRRLRVAILAVVSCLSVGALSPVEAATFDSAEVNPENFVAVAAPFGNNQYQFLFVEQHSNKRSSWNENGSSPVTVEPLLLNFDFTGICGRSTDSNGYSICMSGQDMGLDYLLRIVQRNGELVLVGTSRVDPNAPEVEIGTTKGMSDGFQKIFLNPGWRFTRRTYQGKSLGHIYLTTDSSAPVAQQSNPSPRPLIPSSRPLPSSPLPVQSTPPERELIFTKPGAESTPPSVDVPTDVPTRTSPANPNRQIPVFVVPTN